MSEWTPKPKKDLQFQGLNLSGEEGFVLSQVDGSTSVRSLVHVTGLPEGRVRQILDRLVHAGAVEGAPSASGENAPHAPHAPHMPPGARAHSAARAAPVPSEAERAALEALLGEVTQDTPALAGDPTRDDAGGSERPANAGDAATPAQEDDAGHGAGPEAAATALSAEDAPDGRDGRKAEAQAVAVAEEDEGAEDEGGNDEKSSEADEIAEASHRKLYRESLSKLEPGLREAMAQEAEDPELAALCFDPLPAVIKGVLDNSHAGFHHARLIARHHMTPQGLEFVMGRAEFFRDAQTQRLLLQNNMLQEAQLKRVLQPRRLSEVYKVTISREIPERTRQKARHVLRGKWAMCDGEERAGLIFHTEGRCLAQLTGLPFDSRTTSMLCSKSYTSTLLIQNLARFGATPPPVLAHLLKQQAVRRQPMLRNLVLQHPNCPADAKRKS